MNNKSFIFAEVIVFLCLFYNVYPLSVRNTQEVKPPFTVNVTVEGYLNVNAFSRLFKVKVLYTNGEKCFEEKKKSTYLLDCKSSSSKPKEKDFTFKKPFVVNCIGESIDKYEGTTDDYYFSCALKNNSTQEIVDIGTSKIPNTVWNGVLTKLLFVLLMLCVCWMFKCQVSSIYGRGNNDTPSVGNTVGYAPVPTDGN